MWVVKTVGRFTILFFVTGENREILQLNYFDEKPDLEQSYDSIVVGSAIANRLSENENWTVLLIDREPEANTYNDIPFLNVYTLGSPYAKFNPVEENLNYCSSIKDGRCQWPEGNGLGGASLINGMKVSRGYPSDYDRWAEDGNEGWSFDDLIYYFKKLENMTIDLDESDQEVPLV